jgi:hypothetical protein
MSKATLDHYVYALVDPRDETIGYVGVTKMLRKRYLFHLTQSLRLNALHIPRCEWINELERLGLVPLLSILERTTHGQRLTRERWWVAEVYRRGEYNEHFERWMNDVMCRCNKKYRREVADVRRAKGGRCVAEL